MSKKDSAKKSEARIAAGSPQGSEVVANSPSSTTLAEAPAKGGEDYLHFKCDEKFVKNVLVPMHSKATDPQKTNAATFFTHVNEWLQVATDPLLKDYSCLRKGGHWRDAMNEHGCMHPPRRRQRVKVWLVKPPTTKTGTGSNWDSLVAAGAQHRLKCSVADMHGSGIKCTADAPDDIWVKLFEPAMITDWNAEM
jgi:hypothetical protein